MHHPDPFLSELGPEDRVVWSGRPRQGIAFGATDLFAVPFTLLWAGFAVFWVVSATRAGAPLPFLLFGSVFVLVGLYLVVGRFFADAVRRKHTHYAVTRQRILIISGRAARRVRSVDLATASDLALTERRDGSGTISFGNQQGLGAHFGGLSNWPGADQYLGPRLEQIPNARTVYQTIRDLQADLRGRR